MMNCIDRKNFRFHVFILLYLAFFVSFGNCSDNKQSTHGCLKVASKFKDFLVDNDASKVDAQFLADFADCIQGVYKNTYWTTVEKIIPGVERFIKEIAPQMANKAGKAGLEFTSAYLFHKTIDLHGRAVELELDSEFYRKAFKNLHTKKIQPLLEWIKRDILPLLDKLNDTTLSKLTESTVKDLGYHTKELIAMSRTVYKDFKDAHINKGPSFGYGGVAASLCVASLFLGQPYLAALTCSFGIFSAGFVAYNFYSFSNSGQKLQLLIEDIELLCDEIEDYLTLLKDKYPVY